MGECPDWYPWLRVSRYSGIPLVKGVADVFDLPLWWYERLLLAEGAEAEARAMANDMAGS